MIYNARNTQFKKPNNSFKKKRAFIKPQTIRKPIRRQKQTPLLKRPFFTIIIWAKHSTHVKSIIQKHLMAEGTSSLFDFNHRNLLDFIDL